MLYIEQELHHIPVLHHILFSLASHQTFGFGSGNGAAVQKILIIDHLRTDKAPLKIRVDLSCCLGRLGSLLYGPCTGLCLTGCQIAD